jgi:nucleotide-binding universal stress UspA family protein
LDSGTIMPTVTMEAPMKNVLLLIHDDPGQEARLQAALDLTCALSGHLTCLDITPFPLVYDQGMSMAPPVVIDEADQEADNKARLQARLAAEDVSWSWKDLRDDFVAGILQFASAADVVVLNRKLETGSRPNMRAIASDVLTHSDALVVAVDEHCPGLDVAMPALIAWDGSEEAMRAMQRALPLLKLATRVRLFQAGPIAENAITAEEAARYLSLHGINSEIEIEPDHNRVAADICNAAERFGAGYCIMGAFGHSRLREALLGGASRDMLSDAPLPLIMAH